MNQVLQIDYDAEGNRLIWDDMKIHCGCCMVVLLADGEWHEVSFELSMNDEWYIPGFPGVSPVGLWAKMLD